VRAGKTEHIEELIPASRITLPNAEIARLETLADAADVITRGWWEKEM
jgi:hypothetical protein